MIISCIQLLSNKLLEAEHHAKLTLMKFFVGGFAVLLSYIVSVTLPWKEFGGIFATFPAVFLVSMFITGMQYGDKVAVHVSRAVFGMTGVLVCILVTWMMLHDAHVVD